MTLEYLMQAIGEIAIHNNLVGWYGAGGSVYAVNAENVKEYPLLFLAPTGDHLVRESTTRYTVTIFYMDRLFDDDANATQVTSNGIETLKNLYRQIPQIEWVTDVQEEPRIRIFGDTEKMNDRVAGAYMTLWIDVLNPSVCPVYFDEYGYPIGNWLPPVVTTNVLDNLASKNWVYQIIGELNNIDPAVIEALITSLANYTETEDFATINGDKITEGGDFELATKEDVQDLDERVTELENQSVDSVTEEELQDVKDDLQDQIDAIDLTPFATHSEVQTVDGKVDALEDRVESLEDTIPTLATKQDAQGLQDQIDAIDLSPFATKTELQTTESNLQDGIDALALAKQDKLTAGWGITITGNTIEESIPVFKAVYDWSNISEVNDYVDEKWGTDPNIRFIVVWNGYTFACEASGSDSWYGGALKTNYMMYPSVRIASVIVDHGNLSVSEQDVDYRTFATVSQLANKQDVLTPGTGITIQNNVISATGAGIQPAPNSPNQIACIWSGSQAQYEALGTYHSDWLYYIDR